jgi:hypothetical protein
MPATGPWSPRLWVLLGGFIAGALDIVFAIVFWALKADVPALRILQSVAAGLLGKESFRGGLLTAALGLMLHFLIAISMSMVIPSPAAVDLWRCLWTGTLWRDELHRRPSVRCHARLTG